jgi:hypothetical protein
MIDKRSDTGSPPAGGIEQRAKAADRTAREHLARNPPDEFLNDDELVDEASQDSFPASDPPSFMAISNPGRPPR